MMNNFKATFLKKWFALLTIVMLASASFAFSGASMLHAKETHAANASMQTIALAELPKEAQATLLSIKQGGPFAYDKDGVVFGNYESRLPKQKRGYYHEYTVKTPRARNRGVRRVIAGGEPATSGEYYYTDDHYESFKQIKE